MTRKNIERAQQLDELPASILNALRMGSGPMTASTLAKRCGMFSRYTYSRVLGELCLAGKVRCVERSQRRFYSLPVDVDAMHAATRDMLFFGELRFYDPTAERQR